MSIPKKPEKKIENFIMEAKDEMISDELENKKTKKFLIEMEYELWFKLKMIALQQNKRLKDLIIEVLKKGIEKNYS
ncbi:MAG: hypothetical protein QXV17_14455 [Candidatus Micrarchaeaceae archaeon]|nr:hypothetical protein [Candidatus Parvarchaeum tengchongense]